jgi:hypothetical protein
MRCMLTYAEAYVLAARMLTYAHVCSRMLTYAHVYSRMLLAGRRDEDKMMLVKDKIDKVTDTLRPRALVA